MNKLLNQTEVAKALGISRNAIRALIKQGRFAPSIEIGKTPRWRASDITAWLDQTIMLKLGGEVTR